MNMELPGKNNPCLEKIILAYIAPTNIKMLVYIYI